MGAESYGRRMGLKQYKRQHHSFCNWFCCQRQMKIPIESAQMSSWRAGQAHQGWSGCRRGSQPGQGPPDFMFSPHPGLSTQLCEGPFAVKSFDSRGSCVSSVPRKGPHTGILKCLEKPVLRPASF